MASLPSTAPILSTPESHIFSEPAVPVEATARENLSDQQAEIRYEIERTIAEIKARKWHRVALQFPDDLLADSVQVYQLLARGLKQIRDKPPKSSNENQIGNEEAVDGVAEATRSPDTDTQQPVKLTILADTSYGSCCVDEIAAEHVDADAVVHYGRACLSPTARIPVVHVFTNRPLDYSAVGSAFTDLFRDLSIKVILTADVTYANHIEPLHAHLKSLGYDCIFPAAIIHDPSSAIPNRAVPDSVRTNPEELKHYELFHISDPPTSLLLTLASRVANVYIYATTTVETTPTSRIMKSTSANGLLRRRYGLVTSLATVSTWGILINTLSVKNYLDVVEHVKKQIADAGRKSYLFVVGKLNAAKVANFSDIGGWVVIGCWESSLIDSKDFYKPVITPFELELTLQQDSERVWTGQWISDFQIVLDRSEGADGEIHNIGDDPASFADRVDGNYDSEEESAPPEFDLRTGRYVSRSSHVTTARASQRRGHDPQSNALVTRAKGDMVTVNGVVSPAAEFLRSKRTWQGLGSDFEVRYDQDEEAGSLVEEGRTGIARGYTVGKSAET